MSRELGNVEEPTLLWLGTIEVQEEHQAGTLINGQAYVRYVHLCELQRMLSWACTECVLQGAFLNCRQVVASGKMNVRSLGIKWSPED